MRPSQRHIHKENVCLCAQFQGPFSQLEKTARGHSPGKYFFVILT